MRVSEEFVTYENVYFTLWETAQRYSSFTQFRVIGKSHDDRMIPMLEIGTGEETVFCLCGLDGRDRHIPGFLGKVAQDYCQSYECGWTVEEFYDIKKLLDKVRICMIPLMNPDGFEVVEKGYGAIRNPIYRQMLRMQRVPGNEFCVNARGVDVRKNFPTNYYSRKRICEEPASENETRALLRIFQEYKSRGLLYFCQSEKRIVYYRRSQSLTYNHRSYRLARHLQKCSGFQLEKTAAAEGRKRDYDAGTPEQFYAQTIRHPALTIEIPAYEGSGELTEKRFQRDYDEIRLLPLEYIYSLDE